VTGTLGAASVSPAMNDPRMLATGDADARRSEASVGMDQGLRVLSYLISGVMFYGGLGWLGDHFLGTGFLLPVGIIAGAAFGVYVIIRRFGQLPESAAVAAASAPVEAKLTRPAPDTTEGAL
jgi:F0F1-type ATP synthase assembly protein I